jgi:hypothetical protein
MESNRVDGLSASLEIDCPKLSVSLVVFAYPKVQASDSTSETQTVATSMSDLPLRDDPRHMKRLDACSFKRGMGIKLCRSSYKSARLFY